jgi:hypothetical protein
MQGKADGIKGATEVQLMRALGDISWRRSSRSFETREIREACEENDPNNSTRESGLLIGQQRGGKCFKKFDIDLVRVEAKKRICYPIKRDANIV